MKKKIFAILGVILIVIIGLCGCRESDRATYNVQQEADNFNVERRLSVINARTDKPLLTLTGYFSISNDGENELVVTSEVSQGKYKVDYVYLNAYTMYVVEDITGADVTPYHYEINFLPEMILPAVVTSNK